MTNYTKNFEVRWVDLDPNRHLRNTCYGDYATHVRFSYLADHGFPPARFAELEIGPVILREQARYLREVRMGETISIDLTRVTLAPDGARWRLRHDVYRRDGVRAAILEVEGGWLDLVKRRLTRPPDQLRTLLEDLPQAPADQAPDGP